MPKGCVTASTRDQRSESDGCFWHKCPTHFSMPVTNMEFWREKIDGNEQRDRQTTALLEDRGWLVLRFWEHEDPVSVADRIVREIRDRPHR